MNIYGSPYLDTTFCRTIPGLTKYQIELCNQQPDTTMVAIEGLNQAVLECQNQFNGHKWNCSSLSTKGKNPYISAMFQRGYKETAFSYAISSAGVVIAVSKACSSGTLLNCGCDEKIYKFRKHGEFKENYNGEDYSTGTNEVAKMLGQYYYPSRKGNWDKEVSPAWKWGGCSHNLKFGIKFSKLFLDSRETAEDIRSKTNLHNNQVGRMVVKHNMVIRCKCHGVSGSCQMKTCWRSTPDLKIVGGILKSKFSSAILADHSNLGSKNKINMVNPRFDRKKPGHLNRRKNKKKRDLSFDLLYYEKSPNFCDKNHALDVPGTTGRLCNSTIKTGPNSCSSLCCGRGYNSIKQMKLERCQCKFIWCCEVKCDLCNNTKWINVCK
ncbi:hypothetical protein ABEB36_010245 [Hypothenemus hampei]